jgi:toxin CptA
MKSAPAIAFDFRPSRWLNVAVWMIVTLAVVAVAFCGIPFWAKGSVVVGIGIYAAIWRLRSSRTRIRRLSWYEAGHWRTVDVDGEERLADLQTGIVRGTWIALRLRDTDGRNLGFVLGPDNSSAELRRQLRVRLARVRDQT